MHEGVLRGRTALVTGASSGIGAAIITALLEAGATVHGAARRGALVAEVVGQEAMASGRAVAHSVDLSTAEGVVALAEAVSDAAPDIVVCVAGTNITDRRFEQLTDESWRTVLSLNLDSVAALLQRTVPAMRGRGGDVVLISSVSGRWPDHAGPAYAVSKAGLIALGRGISLNEHSAGVRVTSVLPGLVDTPLIDKRPSPPPQEMRDWCLKPEDVAAAVLTAVSLPPRAHIPEVVLLATRLQAIGNTHSGNPALPEDLEGLNPTRFISEAPDA